VIAAGLVLPAMAQAAAQPRWALTKRNYYCRHTRLRALRLRHAPTRLYRRFTFTPCNFGFDDALATHLRKPTASYPSRSTDLRIDARGLAPPESTNAASLSYDALKEPLRRAARFCSFCPLRLQLQGPAVQGSDEVRFCEAQRRSAAPRRAAQLSPVEAAGVLHAKPGAPSPA